MHEILTLLIIQHQRTCFDHSLDTYQNVYRPTSDLGIPIRKRTELNETFFHRVGNHALIQVVQLNELIPFFSCFKKKFEYFHSTNTIHYSLIFNLANRYELSE